jgi:hypothetical protein
LPYLINLSTYPPQMESFIKSRAIEVNLPEDVTEYGRYEPKALFDDIASEVDILEDKKDNLISKLKRCGIVCFVSARTRTRV